jgi:hypothetical protein
MVQIHMLTVDTSIELMEHINAVLAELQAQFCTIADVKFSWTGSDADAGGQSAITLGVLIIHNTPVEQALARRFRTIVGSGLMGHHCHCLCPRLHGPA